MATRRVFGRPLLVWLGLFGLALLTAAPASAQQQDARIALVIGNANYPDAGSPLPNAIKDAGAVAKEFRRLKFDVTFKTDLRRQALKAVIAAFAAKIGKGTTAVFYFSGVGLQVARQSYLLPVDPRIWSEDDARRDGVNVDALLIDMHRRGAKAKIVVIDAARRNPFERRFRKIPSGLAALNAPVDTLVLYSGALNKPVDERTSGGTSLFAAELIKQLRAPNLGAEEMFKRARVGVSRISNGAQVPWLASSLLGDIYFGEKPSGAPAVTARVAPPAPPQPVGPPVTAPPAASRETSPKPSAPPRAAMPSPVTAPPAIPQETSVKPSKSPRRWPNPSSPPVHNCDRWAAHPFDPKNPEPGKYLIGIDAPRAIAACRSAITRYPLAARFHYQLGRALQKAGSNDEARKQYLKAADMGYTTAMNNMGWVYRNGVGLPEDPVKSIEWYTKSAELGDGGAMEIIGDSYKTGFGVAKDEAKAAEWYGKAVARYRKQIEKGDIGSMIVLGGMYQNGKGVTQDAVRGVALVREAANKGTPHAMYWLGQSYEEGLGVARDDAKAAEWYLKAAEQGQLFATYKVGRSYLFGMGVEKNGAKALAWFRKAADKGSVKAMHDIGWMYLIGRDVNKDNAKAVEWFEKSAKRGNASAMYYLGSAHELGLGVRKDETVATDWYRKAAAGGNERAKQAVERLGIIAPLPVHDASDAAKSDLSAYADYKTGQKYFLGMGVERDDEKALEWFRKAAGKGSANAMHDIGWMYLIGQGVKKNDARAVRWFKRSAKRGNASAMYYLGRAYQNGSGVGEDETVAIDWYRKAAAGGNEPAKQALQKH